MVNENPFSTDPCPRRVMPLIFLVDTSGSMKGAKIASLNQAVQESLGEVGEISKNNSDAQIKIGILEFSSDVRWMYDQLLPAESFNWTDMEAAGLTSFGAALTELNAKLSRSRGFMTEPSGLRAPAIILLSDGFPTDEYLRPLEKLKENKWFKVAVKVAIAIGDEDTDKQVFIDFTGNAEAVITVHNINQLKKIIHAVSLTSSMVASQNSSTVNTSASSQNQDNALTNQTAQSLNAQIQNDKDLQGVDQGTSTANSGTDDWNKW